MSCGLEWSGLNTARVSLADAAMCMDLINESLFDIALVRYVTF